MSSELGRIDAEVGYGSTIPSGLGWLVAGEFPSGLLNFLYRSRMPV